MARPIKDGVDYFPKNTDFYQDDKVRLLRARFGAKGMYLLDYLLCDLYGKNGYYIEWNENKCFLVSDGAGCGCDSGLVKEFITGCLQCSFFDERVFNVFGILTSSGIQRRYIRMFNSRDEIQIIKEYWLLNVEDKKDVPLSVLNKITFKSLKSTENPDKSTENPDKSTENSQSKVKENKVNKSKVNNISSEQVELATEPTIIALPMIDGNDYPICQSQIDDWADVFPAVDILADLKRMRAWLNANPTKRKTPRGIKRFIVTWLSKTQDSGGTRGYRPKPSYDKTDPAAYTGEDDSEAFLRYARKLENT